MRGLKKKTKQVAERKENLLKEVGKVGSRLMAADGENGRTVPCRTCFLPKELLTTAIEQKKQRLKQQLSLIDNRPKRTKPFSGTGGQKAAGLKNPRRNLGAACDIWGSSNKNHQGRGSRK